MQNYKGWLFGAGVGKLRPAGRLPLTGPRKVNCICKLATREPTALRHHPPPRRQSAIDPIAAERQRHPPAPSTIRECIQLLYKHNYLYAKFSSAFWPGPPQYFLFSCGPMEKKFAHPWFGGSVQRPTLFILVGLLTRPGVGKLIFHEGHMRNRKYCGGPGQKAELNVA